ncbi:hypothetical protein [Streptomyces sp. CB01881]|uniref:3-dehydroquinate synthase family protein n=1 Tax=Streptomyces sp. CB01881 TaxID=2078691 RepID=UPI000CDC5395|nr:hypothetical protein [Streptomyces sp. CB01881]AUY49047.1 hypothetical protein C2142_08940 [Streptomyces sp. CB01881]TYC77538.1 hypothetical protein EH183_08945 [Streptomyces sp. CB01881]
MGRTGELDRRIQAGPANFALLVRRGEASWAELADRIAGFGADRFVLVADAAAPADGLARVRAIAAAIAPCTVLTQPGPSPARPSPARPTDDGRTVVIAVGGERACGVPADIRLPTTLAAACGPALTLLRPPPDAPRAPSPTAPVRTAPALVWVRSDLLAGRPAPETRAGMVEVVRHVLAVCPAQFAALARTLRPDARYTPETLAACVALCADARAALVCFDPFETGPALALGYGRRLGEAVRRTVGTASGVALAPGDADALGLLLAARIAAHLGLLDGAGAWAHNELLARNGSATALPAPPAGADARALAAALTTAAGPGLLLLAGLGRPHCAGGRLLTPVDASALLAAVEGPGRTVVPHSRGPAPESLTAAAG